MMCQPVQAVMRLRRVFVMYGICLRGNAMGRGNRCFWELNFTDCKIPRCCLPGNLFYIVAIYNEAIGSKVWRRVITWITHTA